MADYLSEQLGLELPDGLKESDGLNEEVLQLLLKDKSYQVQVVSQVDSTNRWAERIIKNGEAVDGLVLTAEHQSQGQGSRGRTWISPFASSLAFSFLKPAMVLKTVSGFTLSMGIALARALQTLGCNDVELKWPNDVLINRQKLGGILVTVLSDVFGQSWFVIGVGINVYPHSEIRSVQKACTVLSDHITVESRNHVLARLIRHMDQVYQYFLAHGFDKVLQNEWADYNALAESAFELDANGSNYSVVGCGVDENGALVFEIEGQRMVAINADILNFYSDQ